MITLQLGRGTVEALAFGPDSRTLVVPWGARGLLVWDDPTADGKPRTLGQAGDWHNGPVRFGAEGRLIECGVNPKGVYNPGRFVYRADGAVAARVMRSRPPAYLNAAFTAALTPDGSAVVVCENVSTENRLGGHRTRIDLWPLDD